MNDFQTGRPSRRRFLLASGAAWAAASLVIPRGNRLFAQASATTMASPPSKPLGWAFVGLGGFTQRELLPGIARCKYSKCVAVVTGHPEKVNEPNRKLDGKSIKDAFGLRDSDVYSYENYDAIKDNPTIDVVYVVLPNGMHCEYTVRGFKAGKHVMCEKPMANTAAEAQQMIDAGKAANKRLQIGYRMHWDAPTDACIASLRRGDIGKIKSVEAGSGFNIGPGVWRLNRKLAGGGCLMDIGIYSLSAARYLTGEEPTEVSATVTSIDDKSRFSEVESDCKFDLTFPSGAIGHCDSSYARHLGRFAINGSAGMALMEPSSSYSEPPDFNGPRFQLSRTPGGKPEPIDVNPSDQFVGEMDGFSLALAGAAPFMATGEEGLQDMRIIDAIYESGRTGKPVKLA